MNENITLLKNTVQSHLDSKAIFAYAPGRINLIGEHTDYNGGYVFPAAINFGIVAGIQKNNSDVITVVSLNLGKEFKFNIYDVYRIKHYGWENYVAGVVAQIIKEGYKLDGFDLILNGNIPLGSGLSSSAALENSIVIGLNELFELGLTANQMIAISQKAEHNYVGVKCGIMDQYTSMLGIINQAFLLNCSTLETTYTKIDFEEYELILINSNVHHSLANSEYNNRRAVCERVASKFQVNSVSEISKSFLKANNAKITSEEFLKVNYVIQENERVINAFKSLKNNDLSTFGKLLFESHNGLQYEYQVSCPELDFLVEFARSSGEVIGSRMMGAGFGGCTINLIDKQSKKFLNNISKSYFKKFNKNLSIIPVKLDDGARILRDE